MSAKGVEDATLKRYLRWLGTGKLVEKAAAISKPARARSGRKPAACSEHMHLYIIAVWLQKRQGPPEDRVE